MNEKPTKALSTEEKQELETVLEKLKVQAEEFEVTHPELVDTVNRLCIMLANIGI